MRIAVAIDLSSRPEEVITQAATWATRLGGRIDLLHVDETPAVASYVTDPALTAIVVREEQRLREGHLRRLNELLASLPEEVRGEAQPLRGDAAEALIEAAADSDLLMVGTHGRRGLAHLWLGSVAEKVVRGSTVPVLVLHLGPES